jgi:predicted dehydrogenase
VIKLGLIGAGRWGRNYIKTIAGIEGVQLSRLASRNPESATLVGDDCVISPDWHDLLDAGDLHGLIVAAPPALHAAMATAAISVGVPVLVEKPLTVDAAEARNLLAQARAKRSLVMVDHTHLFHPAFEGLCRKSLELGAVQRIYGHAGNHGPYRRDVNVLWDWGPHDVAMCIALTRRVPTVVDAVCNKQLSGGESVRLHLVWPDGVRANLELSNVVGPRRQFMVFCEGGGIVYDDLARDKLVIHQPLTKNKFPHGSGTPVRVSSELPLTRAVNKFLSAIVSEQFADDSLNLGVSVVEVLASCAALIQRHVAVDEDASLNNPNL